LIRQLSGEENSLVKVKQRSSHVRVYQSQVEVHDLKFGVQHPNFTYDGTGAEIHETLKALGASSERYGFDSLWVMDHFHQIGNVGAPHEPMLEGWTTISVLAGLTSKIKLGTMVTGVVYRHPSMLAKVAATLDVLSKGRLNMGIGAAWNEEESRAYGIPFPSTGERFKRLEEALQIIKKMWTEEKVTFNGKFYQISNAYCNPKPLQKPHPPILIGGGGERKTLKFVAKYADACNVFGSPKTVKRKFEILRNHCKTLGRDYESISKTKLGVVFIDNEKGAAQTRASARLKNVPEDMRDEFVIYGTPEEVYRKIEAFQDVGVDHMITSFEPQREIQSLELFGSDVAKRF
jgi:F420-dependent oxidoreductase-like protein